MYVKGEMDRNAIFLDERTQCHKNIPSNCVCISLKLTARWVFWFVRLWQLNKMILSFLEKKWNTEEKVGNFRKVSMGRRRPHQLSELSSRPLYSDKYLIWSQFYCISKGTNRRVKCTSKHRKVKQSSCKKNLDYMHYIVQENFPDPNWEVNAMREKAGIFNSKIITLRQSYCKNIINHGRFQEIHIA